VVEVEVPPHFTLPLPFSCHPSPKAEDLLFLPLLLPVLLFVIPQGSAVAFVFAVACFSSPIQNPVISTGAIHSLTANRAAEKSASLPMPHPSPDVLSLL
jgi:hypothetical protein